MIEYYIEIKRDYIEIFKSLLINSNLFFARRTDAFENLFSIIVPDKKKESFKKYLVEHSYMLIEIKIVREENELQNDFASLLHKNGP